LYLIELTCFDKYNEDTSRALVYVHPHRYYGEYLGLDLMREHLSKKDGKKFPLSNAQRKAKWRAKEVYPGVTNKDIEALTRTGNELNDKSFREHLHKLKTLDGKARQDYLNNLVENDSKFEVGNEALAKKYRKLRG